MKLEMKHRTKKFAIDCWELCCRIPQSREYDAYVRQLIRASSSVGANYRAAQRAKSTADFINKLKIVEEEADESQYFLELFSEVIKSSSKINSEIEILIKGSNEIVAIVVSSIKTARNNQNK